MWNLIKRNPLLPISLNVDGRVEKLIRFYHFSSRKFCINIIVCWWWCVYPFSHCTHKFDTNFIPFWNISYQCNYHEFSRVQKLMQTENGKYQMNMSLKHRISVVFCRKYLISGSVRWWWLLKFSEPQHLFVVKDLDSTNTATTVRNNSSNNTNSNGKYAKHHPPTNVLCCV